MPSVIEGYSYDVFISYRQKDNRHDCWVTEFVDQLKGELETTFKEEISVYFDENPVDGLLEIHSVDKSLEDKLKCLVFIPVISHTYCDKKSYAWQHELCIFNKLAKEDKFGRDIKLFNRNVASRILPVRIHDLDPDDNSSLEKELGGTLRSIDFIYRSAGVNRPLRADENHPQDNLNKTYYRDQINKVANAIKQIISVMKSGPDLNYINQVNTSVELFSEDIPEKSIAVLPFVNMSSEKDQDYFCDGLAEEIIHTLAHNEDLKVISRTSAFAFKDKLEDIRDIGRKLGVATLLEGSIRKSGSRLRTTVQLIKVEDGSHIWSERYDREVKDVFDLQDEISHSILDSLKVKLLGKKKPAVAKLHSDNQEAYNLYLKGTYHWQLLTAEGYSVAAECFEQALQIDPNYAHAYMGLAYVTGYSTVWGNIPPNVGWPKINQYINKVLEMDPKSADAYSGLAGLNVYYHWNWREAEKYFKLALQINPNASQIHLDYSNYFTFTGRHSEAVSEAKRAQELDPFSIYINTYTGFAFEYAGQFDNAIEEYKRTLAINPNYYLTHYHLGRAYLSKRMLREAITEYELAVELSAGTPLTVSVLAQAYHLSGKKDEAMKLLDGLLLKSETEYVPGTTIYLIYHTQGEHDAALMWLKRACKEHDTLLPWFRAHPILIQEGSDYMKLLKEAGLNYQD